MRSSRLISILILLQVRGRVTAAELAREFEVSERTIYRDMDALSAAGIPLYGDPGHGGGFALLDGYQTRLTGLDAAEAEALPMMGLTSAAAALGLGQAASSARGKVWAALSPERKEQASRVAERLHIDMAEWYRSSESPLHLPLVARAVLGDQWIEMQYESWRSVRRWRVAPLGLVMKAGRWYLVASTRGKERIFRLSNMHGIRLCAERFVRPRAFVLAQWWAADNERFENELFRHRATLLFTATGAERLTALSPRGAAAVRRARTWGKGWQLAEMMIENSDHGAREMLGLGAEVQILSPADFRARVQGLATDIAALYTDNRAIAASS
jgi:predicted DNA-binding transcriptional regulator YafY